jgi:cation:H+ antiporter
MTIQILILILSIVALYFGAEFALDAAEKVGRFFGLSPLVIGLLLIGFGTSLPEMFVSQLACYKGESGIALGNIIGSNIANLFLILGVAGLMAQLHMVRDEIKNQLFAHLGLTLLLGVVITWVKINWISTAVLGCFFVGYLFYTFREMKKQRHLRHLEEDDIEEVTELGSMVVLKLIAGFTLLYFGGEWLVNSGTALGKLAGISPYVISAVFVAFGTSFPELVTALLACFKKKNTDLITGNIIGSNVFNVAFVMGSIGFYDVPVNSNFILELSVLMFASLFLLAISLFKRVFHWPSGALFLAIYAGVVFSWIK